MDFDTIPSIPDPTLSLRDTLVGFTENPISPPHRELRIDPSTFPLYFSIVFYFLYIFTSE